MRMLFSLVLVLGALLARPAVGYPTNDGAGTVGVAYPFRGTVTVFTSNQDLGCCVASIAEGDTVLGSLYMTSVFGVFGNSTDRAGAVWQVPGGSVGVGGFAPLVADGPPGPDEFAAAAMFNPGLILSFNPGWSLFSGQGGFDLVDVDGTAWTGLNPRTGKFLPDYAPPISDFESARIIASFGAVNTAVGFQDFDLEIHIDEFLDPRPVPEPPLALLALISSAAAMRRGGRAAARASRAARASPD